MTNHRGKPHAWMAHARCNEVPAHIMFPTPTEDPEPAKSVCRQCPVIAACAEYALTPPVELHGVWGGLTAYERARRRRRTA